MKKITMNLVFAAATALLAMTTATAQFGCGSGVVISSGYTATGITTPGNGGAADWATVPTGTSINANYWDDDVYLFQYTAGTTSETISMTTFSRKSWNGIGIFSACTGTTFSGELAAQGTTSSNATKTVTAIINPGQTVYIATGQWGTPNGLDFDVTAFTATAIVAAPNCTAFTAPLNGATATPMEGVLTWTAAANASGYKLNLGTTAGGTDVLNMFNAGNVLTYNVPGMLLPSTTYYATVIAYNPVGDATACTEISFTTGLPPANDNCSGAVGLQVNPDYNCASTTTGTLLNASDSGVTDNGAGTPDDDVWYSFVATATSQKILLSSVTGTPTDLVHEVMTGNCGALTSVLVSDSDTSNPSGLVIGATYYVRVFTYGAGGVPTTNFTICVGTPPAPPANDNCNGAIALTVNPDYACGATVNATLSGSTNSGLASTTGTADDDVWFSFVATATAHRISLTNVTGTPTDLVHQTLSGDCSSLTSVLYSDADTSNLTGLVIGNTYYVRVYSYTSGVIPSTNFTICVGTPAVPANDNFANAIAVTCGSAVFGNTTDASIDEDNAPDGFGSDLDSRNVWYKYTGNGTTETVTVSLCGSAYDTSLLVYTGTTGNLTLVAGNDDSSACTSGNNSQLSFTSDGVTTYYITVEGYNTGNYGAFSMAVSCAAVTPPAVANQTCALALAVPTDGTDTISDNSFGTVNPIQPSCDSFGSIQDVWFSFVAPASGSAQCLVTNGTMTSSNFNVYSGTCGALVAVADTCNSNLTAPTTEVLTGLTPGSVYYVQVWSNAAEQGTFTLRVTDSTLGTPAFGQNNFAFYPNPVKDFLTLSNSQEITEVAVYNILGQQVIAKHVGSNQTQLDMSGLPKGAYIVKATAGSQSKNIKVVKE
jgi:hypothetical protein